VKSLFLAALAAFTISCSSGGEAITSHNWTCQSLLQPVIDMSKDRELQVLEIIQPEELVNLPGSNIQCRGRAEWNRGYGNVLYGARVSDGESMMLEYSQQ